MNANNALMAAVVGGFLYLGGYLLIAKLAIGAAFLMGVASLAKRAMKTKKTKDTANDNVMDPIEIETKWKPEYKIPGEIDMDTDTKDPIEGTRAYDAAKGTLGAWGKLLGEKFKEDD